MDYNEYETKPRKGSLCPSCGGMFESHGPTEGCHDEDGCGRESEFYTEEDLLEELNFDYE